MTADRFVTDWVLDTVKKEYADDIALVVSHVTLRIGDEDRIMSYFVPVTDRGRSFARTFILEGRGFDIWGIEWERLEDFADLKEYNITCLADGEVLYAKTEEDRDRFEALKRRQAQKLADPLLQRVHALEAFSRAKQVYFEMLFAKGGDVKMGAAYVLDYLARAVCFGLGGFFHRAQTDQLAELRGLGELPEGFAQLYEAIIRQRNEKKQKEQCFELIRLVEAWLEKPEKAAPEEQHFQDLADWYAELAYTWLRIRHYSKEGDVTKTFMWGSLLQLELNQVCGDFGLEKMELMGAFDPDDLPGFAAHADRLEQEMRKRITEGGGKIREYGSREEFLHEI